MESNRERQALSRLLRSNRLLLLTLLVAALVGCGRDPAPSGAERAPNILLITMDTTRWDATGINGGAGRSSTPNLDHYRERCVIFTRAYTTVPTTLAAHASMMTGVYPYQHGIHENGRFLPTTIPTLAQRLKSEGYVTLAQVSGYPLAARFGLDRGFDRYGAPQELEIPADKTTDLAIQSLRQGGSTKRFLWVHYYDPHAPYQAHAESTETDPYRGEIAFMDQHIDRLIGAFTEASGDRDYAVLALADHGEGRGDHGESGHGSLLYETTIRVPMAVFGSTVSPQTIERPISTRRVFDLVLSLARGDFAPEDQCEDVVMAEALQPFLQYGWSPQVAATDGQRKLWRSARDRLAAIERQLGAESPKPIEDLTQLKALEQALQSYPTALDEQQTTLDESAREQLASLGYTVISSKQLQQEDRLDPIAMGSVLALLDRASMAFEGQRFGEALPIFRRILDADPNNLSVVMRMAVAYSLLGNRDKAESLFQRAAGLVESSDDLQLYYGMHCARYQQWQQAIDLLRDPVARQPARTAAAEALISALNAQGRTASALAVAQKSAHAVGDNAKLWLVRGRLAGEIGDWSDAAGSFRTAKQLQGGHFEHELELGIALMENGELEAASSALERVRSIHPQYAVACYRRAQIAAVQSDPKAAEWLDRARLAASDELRAIIDGDPLFQGR